LCESRISDDTSCPTCYAPAEVISSILSRQRPPRFVGVLGPSGVGKTVYLGMLLDLLSRGAGGLHGLAHGPFSLALHRKLIVSLEHQRFPEKTPSEADRWQWVHCEVSAGKRGSAFDIVTPDVAGEAVMAELESPKSNPTVRSLIARCNALVVLSDITQVLAEGRGQELFSMQLISYLATLQPGRKQNRVEVPVALVFTKTDLCEESINDPESFARANAPALWKLCEARLRRYKFFCSEVAGASGCLIDREGRESLVPLRVEPKGIVEPFAWLMTQLR
jgi:hypothetical protein